MVLIIKEKEQKENDVVEINITIKDKCVSLKADNVEYREMLKALEALTLATTKVGIEQSESAIDVYNVIKDITEAMVNGRDSVFEDNV